MNMIYCGPGQVLSQLKRERLLQRNASVKKECAIIIGSFSIFRVFFSGKRNVACVQTKWNYGFARLLLNQVEGFAPIYI